MPGARETDASVPGGRDSDSSVPGGNDSDSSVPGGGGGTTCDDFVTMASACGMGVCLRSGERRCQNGRIVDSCVPGTPNTSDDATCNALDDDCDGNVDENVAAMPSTCAGGACAATGRIACVNGALVDSCKATAPIAATDTTCDNIDDDCNGVTDEDFPPMSTSCGQGVCVAGGELSCMNGMTRNSCVPGSPTSSEDDAAAPGNGVDDDCDGNVDEDLPACDTSAHAYETGSHALSIPGNCRLITVRLWGGAGAAGQGEGLAGGGSGGPGGYASVTMPVAASLQLQLQLEVGGGAASSCNAAGTNPGSSTYDGGSGGNSTGANGADGLVSGGGTGGQPSTGARGGNGYFGGGGGGQGMGGLGASGNGGGGGAATVFIVDGTRVAVAGGGGGGGGAQSLSIVGTLAAAGGDGGSGCRGNGLAPNANGGGGGGGGTCQGGTTQAGSGRNPAFSGDIPAGRAQGGATSCGAGGAGYAIVTFSP